MEPLEFLAAVLPSAGHYCVTELSTKKMEHVFAGSLAELQPHITRFNDAKYNTYFALSTFKEPTNRKADNAQFIRSFFLDLDCGEGKAYPDKKAAVADLDRFLAASGLPQPWVTSSGNGVHVYWPFDQHVPLTDWKLPAENLKRLCKQHGLGIDYTVTADAARVLRMPGTFNWKDPANPRAASIKVIGAPKQHSFDVLTTAISSTLVEPHQESSPLFNVPGERLETPAAPSLVRVLENRITFFKSILDRTAAGKGCGQLKHYIEHATDDGMEPLWRGLLSIAKVCSDGDKAARFLSKLHPYSEARMEQKLREIKGPYPCVKLDSENPGVCTTCPHWGKITNPLALGHEVLLDNTEKVIELPAATPQEAPTKVTRPTPPMGYAYGAKGGVYRKDTGEDGDGNPVVTNKLVLPYDLFAVEILNNGDEGHLVQMVAMRPEGAVTVVLPQRTMGSKDEVIKTLAGQNIIAAYGSGNDKHLYGYVRASVEEVSASRRAIDVPPAFGWQKDNTFVLNGKIFSKHGERSLPMPNLENIIDITEPAGTLESWKQVVGLLVEKKHHDILALACTSLGSPLMHFSDFKALTFHIGSSESGTGKSIALNLAASVWGSEHYILNPKTSAVAQEHRAGALGHLPVIIDEITEMNKDFEWLSGFVMDMTAGKGKDRMKSSANAERRNTTVWRALMLLASNTHATDFFSAVRQKAAEGHLRRILELKMETQLSWTPEEEQTLGLLRNNYGVAGQKYVRWLVRNPDVAKEVLHREYYRLKTDLQATGDERFWIMGCAATIAGSILAGSRYADVIELPVRGIVDSLKKMILAARHIVQVNKRDAEDILNSYTREFFGQFVIVRMNDETNTLMTSFGNGAVTDQSITRSQVKGRIEHAPSPGYVNYYIEEQQLKAWCSKLSYGYSDFKRQLEKKFAVSSVRKDLLIHTRGPQMRVNALKIMRPISQAGDETDNAIPVV